MKSAAAGGAAGAFGFGLSASAASTPRAENSSASPVAARQEATTAAATWYRLASVKFHGYPAETEKLRTIPMPDEASAAVRTALLEYPGVNDAIGYAFGQVFSATDEEKAAEAFWKALTDGGAKKKGLISALQSKFVDGTVCKIAGAYLRRDEPPFDHIKSGFITGVREGAEPELLELSVSVLRGALTIDFKAHVRVALTVARVGW